MVSKLFDLISLTQTINAPDPTMEQLDRRLSDLEGYSLLLSIPTMQHLATADWVPGTARMAKALEYFGPNWQVLGIRIRFKIFNFILTLCSFSLTQFKCFWGTQYPVRRDKVLCCLTSGEPLR